MRDGRLVVCALACAGAMVITACGGDDGGGGGGGGGDAGASKKVKVGFVPKSFESAFWLATKTGAEKAAEGDPNIELTVDAAASESAVEDQIAIVDNMLSKGIDALAIAPSAPDQLQPVLQRAIADGVKVVVVDSDIPGLKDKTAFVGTNNEKAGQTGGMYVKKQLPDGGKVGLVDGTAGIQSLMDRVKGFKQAIDGADIEVVQTVRAEGCTRDHGVSAVEDLLTAHEDLDGIFTACGEPAVGGLQAVKGAGLKPNDLVYVGFDATKDELTAIEGGDEDGSVAQFPEKMGEESVKAAAAAARGETVEKVIDTGSEVVTKDNVAQFK
jgi:ABC-type sugar transport system substrate-binding protein